MSLRRKTTSAAALALSAMLMLTGCGGGATADQKDDGSLMTVDVFAGTANRQGVQKGWFAKIVKDKFNIKLNVISPIVAGGGSTLFDTRSASGNLGDIVIYGTGSGGLKKMVKADLVADMTPYAKDAKNIKRYQQATDHITKVAGSDGLWGIPTNVSTQSPTKPSEGDQPQAAPFIRWDYYAKVGYPQIKDMDGFLTVMKQMQDEARKETGRNDIYAMSLFKDWDATGMQNAQAIASWFGYSAMNSVFTKYGSADNESVLKTDGIYEKSLKFLNSAERMGLVDPESSTQTYDNLATKVAEGKVLVSFWSWLGQPTINTPSNTAKGVGFMLAPIQNLKVYSDGFAPQGADPTIMLGAKAKNKQRLVNFIDWLYSPEGVYAQALNKGGTVCPEKMCWTRTKDGNKLNDFGQKAMSEATNLQVPKEYGGGGYDNGASMLNVKTVSPNDIDGKTGETYNAGLWKSELSKKTALQSDWSSHMGGAVNGIDYLQKKNMILVTPGGYVAPEENSQITTLRGQIQKQIIISSWQAVFAENDAKFDGILKSMRDSVNGLGFDKIEAIDMKNAKDQETTRKDIVKAYQKSQSSNDK